MNWLVLLFAVEAGLLPTNGWWFYNGEKPEVSEPGRQVYTELDAEFVVAEHVFLGGYVRTDMSPESAANYDPFWTSYEFRAGVRFEGLEIGWRHLCTHPIQTYTWGDEQLKTPTLEGSYDEIYIRFTGSVDLLGS